MEALWDLSWRAYPSAAFIAAGVSVLAIGVRSLLDGHHRGYDDPSKMVISFGGFRVAIIGLALVAFGAAWIGQLLWLLVLALVIGGEETLESSMAITALKQIRRSQIARSATRG